MSRRWIHLVKPFSTTNGNTSGMASPPCPHTSSDIAGQSVKAYNVIRLLQLLISMPVSLIFSAGSYTVGTTTEGNVQMTFDIYRGYQVELLSGDI